MIFFYKIHKLSFEFHVSFFVKPIGFFQILVFFLFLMINIKFISFVVHGQLNGFLKQLKDNLAKYMMQFLFQARDYSLFLMRVQGRYNFCGCCNKKNSPISTTLGCLIRVFEWHQHAMLPRHHRSTTRTLLAFLAMVSLASSRSREHGSIFSGDRRGRDVVDKPTIGPPALYAAGLQARVRKDQAKIMDGTLYVTKKDGRV